MQHRPVLGRVDPVTAEHRVSSVLDATLLGESHEQVERLRCDAVLGEVDVEPARLSREIAWSVGDAQNLPLPDASADAYVISFGIRNVTDISRALREARRVLKPGGRFLCLEFSRPPASAIRAIYDAYSFKVIPGMGQIVSGDRDSYQYLVESIRRFPTQDRFAEMMGEAGFKRVSYTNLTGGVAALHHGWAL